MSEFFWLQIVHLGNNIDSLTHNTENNYTKRKKKKKLTK